MSGTGGDTPAGPDLHAEGAALSDIPESGMLLGHVDGEAVLLVRTGGSVYAMGTRCSHWSTSLAEGVFDGEVVRCREHHACFRPETGEAVHAPGFDPVPSYAVEQRGDRIFVTGSRRQPLQRSPIASPPSSVVIVGGGAAGFAAADMLRREGYTGPLTLISSDDAAPYDRTYVSKDYLIGIMQAEAMALRPADWYAAAQVDLLLNRRVVALAPAERQVTLDDGRRLSYGALLLATGATPVQLDTPGRDLPHVHYLRTLRDSEAIAAKATQARRALVVGASFIGLEVAAALLTRNPGLEMHVVAPGATPMERTLGPEVGTLVRGVHEERGVHFHMGQTVSRIEARAVTLKDDSRLEAELVVFGVGVRPNVQLAEQAGLAVDRGVLVDEYLQTSAEGIWAAGDIARWPDPYSGERIRVEHWVVAERQGQTAARNMLGRGERFTPLPFFWSQHFDLRINYVGNAQEWDETVVAGSIMDRDCMVTYRKGGKTLAVASVNRDVPLVEAELAMERGDTGRLEALVGNRQQTGT
jgi:NADPH-dependent 2,4-dienoyl-CoA reductase/sulfur reductase-like enzyme/nitrite reductase/ring-hydroxylating ferredoxin subunit